MRQLLTVARLVTLTGIGGVGKTRLAFHLAKQVCRVFPDGVCLVDLASFKDPALLPHTVIDALAIGEQSFREPMAVLCDYLRPKRMLLVLDNCEHLVDASADLADQVLRAAPDLRILATSRQALRIVGEHIYSVQPLPAPDPDVPLRPGTATQYPSVALFADRAAAVIPGFALTPDNEAAVIRLCHRLEGIPLAIELASVRLRVLTVDDLASRLDDRFALLRGGNRNLPERQQTLQSLIDWSYELCTPAEQTLWARASVFAGGFSTEALEAVCAEEARPEHEVLDTVSGLVDKSIFIREEQDQHVRFRMLETIREYGQAKLAESGGEPAMGRRHRDWYLWLIETAGDEWAGARQQEWASRLQLEQADVRRALEFCLSQPGEARVGLRMAAVPWFWLGMGYPTEGKLWLDRVLALDEEPSHERAWALATGAYIAISQGDGLAASSLLAEARDLAVQLADPAAHAYVTHVLGVRKFLGSDLAGAIPLFDEALKKYATTDVSAVYPDNLRIEFALAHLLLGETGKAADLFDELFDRFKGARNRWQFAYALLGCGFLKLLRGDLDQAEADLCEALTILRLFRDILGLALALDVLTWTTVAKSDTERAVTLLGGTNTLWQTIGTPQFGSMHLIAWREQFEQRARKSIGNAEFDAAFECGSALTAEETLALALRERIQPPEAPRAATVLTRREREIAELVARGLSNKEIAATLIIARRTAEGHVEKILAKLGFNTRAQIASWVTQQQADRFQ